MQTMKVLKFGTSALGNPEKIKLVADIVIKSVSNSIVIVSAFGGTTALLEEIANYLYKKNPEGANEIINLLNDNYYEKIDALFSSDKIKLEARNYIDEKINFIRSFSSDLFTLFEEKIILAQGEILSSRLFTLLLKEKDLNIVELSALDFMKIDKRSEPDTAYIKKQLKNLIEKSNSPKVFVTQGYICENAYNEVDNFNFGGSDYTASLIGAAIDASEIQIWTDIDSFYGNSTQLISNTETVHQINFDEAAELAYFGVKILHPMCILPAKMSNIPVHLLNIYNPEKAGTIISNKTECGKIKAIASKANITVINIKSSRMLFAQGFLRRICEVFEKNETSIDMLTTSEVGVSVTIDNTRYLDEITNDLKKLGTVTVEKEMTLISIIGDFSKNNTELSSKVMGAIKNISVEMISYGGSHNNLSLLIDQKNREITLQILRKNLFAN